MSHNSYLKIILSYFQTMDIEKLRLYLKDEYNYNYQDTTKEIFLNKVASIFEAHKNSGDTELLIYPGMCGANSKSCDGCGKNGYRFVGNNSKNYIDFIFETEGDDIKDIFDCSYFKTNEEIINLGNQGYIFINQDDKVTFNKSPEYWSKVNAATLAYSEIITILTRILNFEELNYWVEKHSVTNQKIGDYDVFQPRMKWSPFSSLYADLKEMRDYILNKLNDFEIARIELENASNEEQYIKWVLKFETLYKETPFDLKYRFEKKKHYYIFQERNPIYFYGKEFDLAVFFLNTFRENEMQLLSKYNTYTHEEEIDAFNNKDAFNSKADIKSLKFHLQKRKAMEEIGLTIPLHIAKTDESQF